MGLAERFKNKLDQNDIFTENAYITKPNSNVTTQTAKIESITNILADETKKEEKETPKFEELETEIIGKIRKTPYWADYSSIKQEHMISKYFDNKIQKTKYSRIEYSITDKADFIKNILALSNSR